MASISADDYTIHDQHVILPDDINNRIHYLRQATQGSQRQGSAPEDIEEFNALRDFRDEVCARTGRRFAEATIVPESQFEDYARYEAHAVADIDIVDAYVDWARFAGNLKNDGYVALEFGDDTVYVK